MLDEGKQRLSVYSHLSFICCVLRVGGGSAISLFRGSRRGGWGGEREATNEAHAVV